MGTNKLHEMLLQEKPPKMIIDAVKSNPEWVNALDDENGCSPLMIAIARGYPAEVVEALISAGADVNEMSRNHSSVVSVVVHNIMDSLNNRRVFTPQAPDLSSLRCVIEHGANIDRADYPMVLYLFASSRQYDFFDVLADRLPDVNCCEDIHGYTPLMLSIGLGKLDVMDKLIARGADINARDKFGHNALFFAMSGCFTGCHSWGVGHLDEDRRGKLVENLIEKGADVNVQNVEGETLLMTAARLMKQDFVSLFLSKGLDVNAKNKKGETALLIAVQAILAAYDKESDYLETENNGIIIADALIAAGADVSCLNHHEGEDFTPLVMAVSLKRTRIIDYLLAHGVDVNAKCGIKELTALNWAVLHHDISLIKKLKKAGAKGSGLSVFLK